MPTEQKTVTPTPGPWVAEECRAAVKDPESQMPDGCEFWIAGGPADEVIALTVGPIAVGSQQANAEFIVRACNSHADLLAACRGVDVVYAELQAALPAIATTDGFDLVQQAVTAARAAIAKAEGQ